MQYLLPLTKLVCMTIITDVDTERRISLKIIDLSRRSARSSTTYTAQAGRTRDLDLDLDLDLIFFLAEEVALVCFLGGGAMYD